MPTLDYTKSKVFFRDRLVPFSEANVSIASSPFLYGLAVYTTLGANWNAKEQKLFVFRLSDHYQRLLNSARIMHFSDFESHWPYERFEKTVLELLARNAPRQDILVRCSIFIDELTAGTRIHGLKSSFSAYIYPLGQLFPKEGAHLCVSSWSRVTDNSIPPRAKVNGTYAGASLAKNEALLNGYDDAILLDQNGNVTESTVANIFIVRDKTLIAPSQDNDLLEGITKDSIMKLATDLNIPAEQRTIDRSELYIADEAFLSGTSANITSVLSVDRRQVGSGKIGELTQKLATVYEATQRGENPKYSAWVQAV